MKRAVLFVPVTPERLEATLRDSLASVAQLRAVNVRRMSTERQRRVVHRSLEALLVNPDKPIPYEVVR